MIRLRKGLREKFRGASEEEYELLLECAEIRREMSQDEREQAGIPDVAEASFGTATIWAVIVMWQDHPRMMFLGCSGLLLAALVRLYRLFSYLVS